MSHVFPNSHGWGTIQKKSASGSRILPCLKIFFRNFILIWKCQKWSLNRGTLVSATAIYQMKCTFTVLSTLFLFFQMLPYDSRLFLDGCFFFFFPRKTIKLTFTFEGIQSYGNVPFSGENGPFAQMTIFSDILLIWFPCTSWPLS